jgi:protein SCO1/2
MHAVATGLDLHYDARFVWRSNGRSRAQAMPACLSNNGHFLIGFFMQKQRVTHDNRRRFLMLGGLALVGGIFGTRRVFAADDMGAMDHGAMDHSHHHDHAAMAPGGVKRSEMQYTIPPGLKLIRQDGKKIDLAADFDSGKPVILNFIYTSCTAICPVTTQVFAQFQEKLGKERNKVNMVSISIDPEYDTPARLLEYRKKYGATEQWQHLTGTVEASVAVQKAFDAYRGDKMNHIPLTFLRGAPGQPWVRLDGFASPDEVLSEYRNLIKKS